MIKTSIVGASGYTGGELLRLLLMHKEVEVLETTSRKHKGVPVTYLHPNLRGVTKLSFSSVKDLKPCDVFFLSLPHGVSNVMIEDIQTKAEKIIDLSADFRLRKVRQFETWYGIKHQALKLAKMAVYGLPELHREEISQADLVACGGCEATVSILALYPLVKEKLIDPERILLDIKIGSSAAGAQSTSFSHHPERSGAVRSYAPTGHRHQVEIQQELAWASGMDMQIFMSATAIEMVRGILLTGQVFLQKGVDEKDVWLAFRKAYGRESFIRIVKQKSGLYRYPEPKIVAGTNYCDIGFEKEKEGNRLVVIAAIDNLGKGSAGSAVQCMNLMFGFEETEGLKFPGLHPI